MSSYKIKYDSFMSRKMKNNLQEILKQNDGCVAYLYGYQVSSLNHGALY